MASALAALLAAATLAGPAAEPAAGTRFENRVAGHTLVLPPGWQGRVHREDGATIVSTFRVRPPLGTMGGPVPPRGARIWLHDSGRQPLRRHVVRDGRPLSLGRLSLDPPRCVTAGRSAGPPGRAGDAPGGPGARLGRPRPEAHRPGGGPPAAAGGPQPGRGAAWRPQTGAPPAQIGGSRLSSFEGLGPGHVVYFERAGHVFMAAVKLGPRATPQTRRRAVAVLESVRLAARAHRIGNVHSSALLGRSERGRPIRLHRVGNPRGRPKILVVGCIHGTECAGRKVTAMLLGLARPIEGELWIVQNLNPDGFALGVRQNGRGVDLNRNFPTGWRPGRRPWYPEYPGSRPFSERETRIARDLVRRVRPEVAVWYHQPQDLVRAWGPSVPAARRFALLAGERFRALPWLAGTAPNWQNSAFPSTASFVVELPTGELPDERARRHARALVALAD